MSSEPHDSAHRAAAIQMASGPNVSANLAQAQRLISEAARKRADLVLLPEHFAFLGNTDEAILSVQERDGEGPIQAFLSREARRHSIHLGAGAVPIATDTGDKVRSAYMLYAPDGARLARYDKIHLFDVTVGEDTAEHYRESSVIEPGDRAVVVDTPFGRTGLAGAYDLRFPELFRTMLRGGLDLVLLPAAFTAVTGRAHWETLVRARAVENLCYVLAAAQGGYHVGGRATWGDSMLVDPWGQVLDRLAKGPGVITGTIDRTRQRRIREQFPTIEHVRMSLPTP